MAATETWQTEDPQPMVDPTSLLDVTAKYNSNNKVMNNLQIVIGSLGIVSNAVVLLVYFTFKELRQRRTMLYIVNQSVVDMLNGLFMILIVSYRNDGREFKTIADTLYCHLWIANYPLFATFNMSTYNLVLLTLERYFSVVYPIKHKVFCTRTKIAISIGIAWIIACGVQLALTSPGIKIVGGVCLLFAWKSETEQRAKGIFGAFMNYLIPIFLLIFCYARMIKALNVKVAPTGSETTTSGQRESNVRARGKRNVIKTMTIVATVYILCSSWNQIWYLLLNMRLVPISSVGSTYNDFSVVALLSNCFVNPFIYAARYEEFKRGLKHIGVQIRRKLVGETNAETHVAARTLESDV